MTGDTEDTIRAFIAIELSDNIKQSLAGLISLLKNAGLGDMRWVQPETVHLTLKFLGNIAVSRTSEIEGMLAECAASIVPFSMAVGDIGAFPNLKAPRVLWVGLDGNLAVLKVLQQCVECKLTEAGFPKEDHAFSPHLTLARVRERHSRGRRPDYERILEQSQPPSTGSMTVQNVSLMRSVLTPDGPIHTRLAQAGLGGMTQNLS